MCWEVFSLAVELNLLKQTRFRIIHSYVSFLMILNLWTETYAFEFNSVEQIEDSDAHTVLARFGAPVAEKLCFEK